MRRQFATISAFGLIFAACVIAQAGDAALEVGSELLRLPNGERDKRLEARFAATPLTLPAGRTSLKEALAALAATGNPTTLATGVDGAVQAEVPAMAGTYWQGVIALCAAFDLVPEPGEGADRSEDSGRFGTRDNEGAPVVPQGGPLVLARRDPARPRPLLLAAGSLLVEVPVLLISQRRGTAPERSGDLALGFRFEPRVPTDAVGATLAHWRTVEDGAGRKLEWSETRGGNRGAEQALLHLVHLPERLPVIALNGEVVVQALEPTSISTGLLIGGSARGEVIGQEVTMRLLGDGEATANNQKGPGLALSVPTTLLGTRPKVQVTAGGQPLVFNPQGSQWSGGRIDLFYRGPKLGEGEHRITVSGVAALKQIRLPVQATLQLDGLPTGEPSTTSGLELQIPTRVTWPAGRRKLNEAVKLLAGANQVLLELGADERKEADLPAFDGTFWEGVIALCRTYDLAVLPPSQVVGVDPRQVDDEGEAQAASYVAGGPLCLGARRAGRRGVESCQASGILLMGVDDVALVISQGLDGISRRADIAYRLRLEPRFDASLVGSAAISWTSLAGFHAGHPLVVEENTAARGDERGNTQFVRVGRRVVRVPVDGRERPAVNPGSSGSVTVTGLPADSVPLTLSGLATLSLRRPVRLELPLAPGGRVLARVGGRTLVVRLATNGVDEQPTNRAGVIVEFGGEAIDGLDVEVRNPAGKVLRTNGNGSTGGNGRSKLYWYLPDLEPGQHTVVVTARERLGTLRLPFALSVTTPP